MLFIYAICLQLKAAVVFWETFVAVGTDLSDSCELLMGLDLVKISLLHKVLNECPVPLKSREAKSKQLFLSCNDETQPPC